VHGLRPLVLSTLCSRIATQMFAVTIVLFVLETRHSAQLSGLVVLASQVPGILVSPIAGALLDRGAKVRLMVYDFGFESICICSIAALSLAHALPTYLLVIIVAACSLTTPLSRVGGRSIFPVIVPRSLWDRSNAVDSCSFVVATVLGPTVAGVSVALFGPRWALVAPGAVMALSALIMLRVSAPSVVVDASGTLLASALGAVRYVWGNHVLRMLAGTMTVFNFGGGALTIALPVIVLHSFHGGSTTVGLLFAISGASGFVAGLLTGRIGTEGREKNLLATSCAVTALAFVVLALHHSEVMVVICIACIGFANGPLTVSMFSLRQRATDPKWYGRAFAVSMNLNFSGVPIGSAIAGQLITRSVLLTFFIAAGCAALGGLWPAVLPASHYEPARPAVASS
jgi:MFS family permease